MKLRYWFAPGAALTLILVYLHLQIAGSAVVVDETGELESAAIVTGDGRTQPLNELWDGYFYAIPELEGAIELRCKNGTAEKRGYATGHLHTEIRVVGTTPCATVVPDDSD